MDAALLQGVKLKKVKKKQQTSVTLPTLCNNSEEYNDLMEETFMEEYFDVINTFSFGTRFLELSTDTAAALVIAHEEFLENKCSSFEDNPCLTALARSIDSEQQTAQWPSIFVRLSSRSPKDAALSSPKFTDLYNSELEVLEVEEKDIQVSESNDVNRRLHALYRASSWALRTLNGRIEYLLLLDRA